MIRSRLSSILIGLLSILIMSGCADDLRHRPLFDGGVGDVMLSFSVENVSLSRAEEANVLETGIDHAYLLFYAYDAVVETSVPIAAVRAEVSETNPSALSFKMPLLLEENTDYQLVAVANADRFVPDGFSSFKDYLEAWSASSPEERQPFLLFHSDPIVAGEVDCLPMSGGIAEDIPFKFTMQGGAYRVSSSLRFRRKVARIDVANMVKQGFVIEGVALCNWRDAVSALPGDSPLGNRFGSVCGVLSDGAALRFVEMPIADGDGVQQLKESIYAFPSVAYDSYLSDPESTALIIKARYGEDTESSYYRVNVGTSGNKAELKANTKYLVTIQSVKGSGASSPEEAYSSDESQIVLSVVEDWDLDGCFAMDENGNFIVLSKGFLEFDGECVENREVRILTSKGLNWTAEYIPENDGSATAFSVSRHSDTALAIGTTGKNTGDGKLSGKILVSALTSYGGILSVEVAVMQNPATGSDEPNIPDDMPFALVPVSTDRVKIDHNARSIEIDAFDPECFNSFIDIPFTIYFKDNTSVSTITVSSDLQWPLEGRISLDRSTQYSYCLESFSAQGTGQVHDGSGVLVSYSTLGGLSLSVNKEDEFFISVGAMGPDDPSIFRKIILSDSKGEEIVYSLEIKPNQTIIDDVILIDDYGNYLLIQDRNIQDSTVDMYFGLDSKGNKYQAYNYSYIMRGQFSIPNKFSGPATPFGEIQHEVFLGKKYTVLRNNPFTDDQKKDRTLWLSICKEAKAIAKDSPFYESNEYDGNLEKWIFPSQAALELCAIRMKVSKMRMYLCSEIPVKSGMAEIQVCSYWPYRCDDLDDTSYEAFGYFSSEEGLKPDLIMFIYFDNNCKILSSKLTLKRSQNVVGRLVRPLTEDELDVYKTNYLGYGSQPHRLQICHPDTYTSEPLGWIPY